MRISLESAQERYGVIENGVWKDEAKWCVLLNINKAISEKLVNSATGQPTTHIYVNKEVEPLLDSALTKVVFRGLLDQLQTFDGCFRIRDVRGVPGSLSTHAYACAVDFNASTNPLGGPCTMSKELVACFTDSGFTWGGNFKRFDGMHFSAAWE